MKETERRVIRAGTDITIVIALDFQFTGFHLCRSNWVKLNSLD